MSKTAAVKVESHGDARFREMKVIASRNPEGLMKPEQVVEYARDPSTALHDRFEWDNEVCGDRYRLYQARMLIRAYGYREPSTEKEHRLFVSLTPDRKTAGGGYRLITSVLSNKAQRTQLLEDAHEEMMIFRRKYAVLQELSVVFAAMDKVLARRRGKKPRK
jgi:hypothetical protein